MDRSYPTWSDPVEQQSSSNYNIDPDPFGRTVADSITVSPAISGSTTHAFLNAPPSSYAQREPRARAYTMSSFSDESVVRSGRVSSLGVTGPTGFFKRAVKELVGGGGRHAHEPAGVYGEKKDKAVSYGRGGAGRVKKKSSDTKPLSGASKSLVSLSSSRSAGTSPATRRTAVEQNLEEIRSLHSASSRAATSTPYNGSLISAVSKVKTKEKPKGPVFDPYLKTLVHTSKLDGPLTLKPKAASTPASMYSSVAGSVVSDSAYTAFSPTRSVSTRWDGDTAVQTTEWGSALGHGPPSSFRFSEAEDPKRAAYSRHPAPSPAPSEDRYSTIAVRGGKANSDVGGRRRAPDRSQPLPPQNPQQVAQHPDSAQPETQPSSPPNMLNDVPMLQELVTQILVQQQLINEATAASNAARSQNQPPPPLPPPSRPILPAQTLGQLDDLNKISNLTAALTLQHQLTAGIPALSQPGQSAAPLNINLANLLALSSTGIPAVPNPPPVPSLFPNLPPPPSSVSDIEAVLSALQAFRLDGSIAPTTIAPQHPLSPPPHHRQIRLETLRKSSSSNGHSASDDESQQQDTRDKGKRLAAEHERAISSQNSKPQKGIPHLSPQPTDSARPPPNSSNWGQYPLQGEGSDLMGSVAAYGVRKESASTIRDMPTSDAQRPLLQSRSPASTASPGPTFKAGSPSPRPDAQNLGSHHIPNHHMLDRSHNPAYNNYDPPQKTSKRGSPKDPSPPAPDVSAASSTYSSSYSTASSERDIAAIERERMQLELQLRALDREELNWSTNNASSSSFEAGKASRNRTTRQEHKSKTATSPKGNAGRLVLPRQQQPSRDVPSYHSSYTVSQHDTSTTPQSPSSPRPGRLPHVKSPHTSYFSTSEDEQQRQAQESELQRRAKMALPPLPTRSPLAVDTIGLPGGRTETREGSRSRKADPSPSASHTSPAYITQSYFSPDTPSPSGTRSPPPNYAMNSPLSELYAKSREVLIKGIPTADPRRPPEKPAHVEGPSPRLSEFDFPLPPPTVPRAPTPSIDVLFGAPTQPLVLRSRPLPNPKMSYTSASFANETLPSRSSTTRI